MFLRLSGVVERCTVLFGEVLWDLAATDGEFDFIFNDVDKDGYPAVLENAPERLRVGGLLITDNTLWHARVLDPRVDEDFGVVEFNRKVFTRNDLDVWISPLRDGVTVARKRY